LKRTNTQSLGEVIKDYLKALGLDKKMKEVSIINRWEEIIGRQIARATKDIYIDRGILFLKIDSSVIKNEILMIKKGLIKKINDETGEIIINDIVLI
jgi:predicted nucleic acid-binding Zn ribbon protein